MEGHVIEHSVGIYIGLLLLACLVGMLTRHFAHVPYSVALTLVGLLVAFSPVRPDLHETDFKHLILFVMLPPLLFQGALHMELNRLLEHIWPILTFAVVGLLISMFIIGGVFYWGGGVDRLLIALLFGAMVTPTDPVSVLSIFKECRAPRGLRYIVEGESLFNDGVGIVVFMIVLRMVEAGQGAEFHATDALWEFVKVTAGGLLVGLVLGAAAFAFMRKLDDHLLENALCLVLAYGAFWVAEQFHTSGVIATVLAALMIGNFGKRLSMAQKTRETVDTFFESIDFIINSILFILIGLELQTVVREGDWTANIRPLGIAVLALLVSRAVSVYPLYRLLNLAGTRRPKNWAHVLYWGGLRGSIPIALLLGLPVDPQSPIAPYRPTLLVAGFGVVLFSLVVQGLTMKPLLRRLGIAES